ncbi:hypothetical protein BGZ76_007832 [Entomortierella beljakovae]|nr:hypothetical protein BGZ76_007832 [Entomortierella beljakovae]
MSAPVYTPVATNPFAGGFPSSDEASAAVSSASTFGLGYFQKFREERLSNMRPLREFFDRNRFSFPHSFPIVTSRFNYNLSYFQGNYLLLFLAIMAYSIFTNFMLMITVAILFGGLQLVQRVPQEGVEIRGSRYYATQLKYILFGFCAILFLISGVFGSFIWSIGASAVVILGHASVMQEGVEGDFVSVV